MNRVSACLIVKNEEEFISSCLTSLIGKVDEIVVIDTGSTDHTLDIAQKFGAIIGHFKWNNDFSAARNTALKMATGDWILVIDADEILNARQSLGELVNSSLIDAYSIKIINILGNVNDSNEGNWFHAIRLFRRNPSTTFTGKIHEQVLPSLLAQNARIAEKPEIELRHYGYLEEVRQKKEKSNRNLEILQKVLMEEPENSYQWFNLGMEYFVGNEHVKAIDCFNRSLARADLNASYFPRMLRNACFSLFELGDLDEGKRVCNEAIQLFPDYADLWYVQALLYNKNKEYGIAVESLIKACSLGDSEQYEGNEGLGSFKAIYFLAEIYLKMDEIHMAIKALEKGIHYYPKYLMFYKLLSQCYMNQGDLRRTADVLSLGGRHFKELSQLAERVKNLLQKTNKIKSK